VLEHRGNFLSLSLHGITQKVKKNELTSSKFTVLKTDKSTYFFFLFLLFTLFLFFAGVYISESKLLTNTRIINY
jgi:hypothetical protein